MTDTTISAVLRRQLVDLQDLYTEARNNDNSASMERLAKAVADMAKRVKEQEVYERETVSRNDFMRLIGDVGEAIGQELCKIEDDSLRTAIVDRVSDRVESIVDSTFTNGE